MANRGRSRNGKPQPQRVAFGEVVVRKGFATRKQVDEALRTQKALLEQTGKHKLIGLVMLEMGILGTTELIDVLKELSRMQLAATAMPAPAAPRAPARSRAAKN